MSAARAAVVGALALLLSGCQTFDDWMGTPEVPLPGERVPVSQASDALTVAGGELVGIQVPAPIENASWSQPGGNPANAPAHLLASGSLRKAWSSSAGTGSSGQGRLTAPPIVVGGRVFVLDAAATVTALSADGGQRAWRAALTPQGEDAEEGFGGGIAADFGRVIVATGFGEVFGLDPSTGQDLWSRDLGLPIRSSPTAANGRVYIVTVNNEVHCLDIETGEVVWDFRRYSDDAGVLANTSPAVDAGVVVVPYRSGELLAFDAATGKPLWGDALTRTGRQSAVAAINDIAGRPAIAGGTVYAVSHSGRLVAIDLKTGGRRWAKNVASTQTPWVAGDTVYVVTLDGTVSAIGAADGKARWVQRLPHFQDPESRKDPILYSGPVLAGGRLLVVSSTGELIAIAPETGQIAERTSIDEPFYIPPIVAGGTVYLLSDDATLIALR
jgi:outer membrane protein assembly factor BamB